MVGTAPANRIEIVVSRLERVMLSRVRRSIPLRARPRPFA